MSDPISILKEKIKRAQRDVERLEDSLAEAEQTLEDYENELQKLERGELNDEMLECQALAKQMLALPALGAGYVYDLCCRVLDCMADEKDLGEIRRRYEALDREWQLGGIKLSDIFHPQNEPDGMRRRMSGGGLTCWWGSER
jgi:chromosome segregation ATPase